MRIAHVVDTMNMGGAERLVSLMCRMQRQQGHDPSVHCIFQVGVLGEDLRRDGFQVSLHGPSRLVGANRRLYSAFSRIRPDVVHCHNPTATIYAAAAARLARVPVVISTRHGLVEKPYRRSQEIKFSIAARLCDWVVGVCDATVSNLAGAPLACTSKLVRVYNGALPLQKSDVAAPAKTGFTLVHVGRLNPIKNQQVLLESLALALRRDPDLSLWIVGDGPCMNDLQKTAVALNIDRKVTFFGEQLDVSPYVRAADAFIMCSISEGLPVSLLEAMSVGVPAIVTEIGGMAEIVHLADCGLIAAPTGPEPLAETIVEMARDRDRAKCFGAKGRTCFEQRFTIDTMVSEYSRLYGLPVKTKAQSERDSHENSEAQCCVDYRD